MKKVIEFLRNNIKEKDSLVVACSGGPDSMCLLDLVTKLKNGEITVESAFNITDDQFNAYVSSVQ